MFAALAKRVFGHPGVQHFTLLAFVAIALMGLSLPPSAFAAEPADGALARRSQSPFLARSAAVGDVSPKSLAVCRYIAPTLDIPRTVNSACHHDQAPVKVVALCAHGEF
ncbi:MAG: hypothetical protein M3N23_11755 [Pseudomonadota bacterium]|nr:hypothetical protein [Pseudomonadota bacterium]